MSVVCIIPARYASSRYPGKPLALLRGATGEAQTLIERSWRAACEVAEFDAIHVATDDDRIADAARAFGASVLMTSSEARNGTERCAEALEQLGDEVEMVVNLQGDAPLTPPWFLTALIAGLRAHPDAAIATPILRCDGETLAALKTDRAAGRVGGTTAVVDHTMRGLYFSKEVIPFTSETYAAEAPTPVFHHVGVYAYRPDALRAYPTWKVGPLEMLEGLEQLRFLEAGQPLLCVEVAAQGRKFWELNNPEDVPRIEAMLAEMALP
ncbi:3-deoxy-manno-octulosonate cytidylyltransferase [Roseicyclus mahoneyensis]|uniref:3-deoxy-manno-octulosonate cytidylyltransferase (CMP-KDO synthetase) n=1 Tax=Roseicyclus mahoneyensis TaxID=164332 RepID=A0A316GKM0_9RHOB|nr:manno-octulosonate cytidylyltransferase [Roseicyclus mahoneyensis]PWK61605.1 3-deoxy-manno-octulosonate cytidylyltransferase (CMP-KDO synthetase) [Roseicyclus mahoneyensis]